MPKKIFKFLPLALFVIGAFLILAPSLASSADCVEYGDVCYQSSDCCAGLTCFLPEGQDSGGCQCEGRTCYYAEFDEASGKCTYTPLEGAPCSLGDDKVGQCIDVAGTMECREACQEKECYSVARDEDGDCAYTALSAGTTCDLGGGKEGQCVDVRGAMECREYCQERDCFTVGRDEDGNCTYQEAAEGTPCDLDGDGVPGDGTCQRGFDEKLWCVSSEGPPSDCDVCDHRVELQKCVGGVIYKCKIGIAWDCWEKDSECPDDKACCNPSGQWCDLCGLEDCDYAGGDLQKCEAGSGGSNAKVYRCSGDNKWRLARDCPTPNCDGNDCYYAPQDAVVQSLTCPETTCYPGETAEVKLSYSVYKETYISKSIVAVKYVLTGLWSENKTESPGEYSVTVPIDCDDLVGLRSIENNLIAKVEDDEEGCTFKYSSAPAMVDLNNEGAPPNVTWQWKHVRGEVTEYRLYNQARQLIVSLSPQDVCAGGIGSDCAWQETGIGVGARPNTPYVRMMQVCNANGCNPRDAATMPIPGCPTDRAAYQYMDMTATPIEPVKKAECTNITKTSITVNALADSSDGSFSNLYRCDSGILFKGGIHEAVTEKQASWTFNNLEPGKSYQFSVGPSYNAVRDPSGSAVVAECSTLSRTCDACGDGFFSNVCDEYECLNELGKGTGGCVFIDRTWPLPNLCLEIVDVPFQVQEAATGEPVAGVLVKVVEGSDLDKEKGSCVTDGAGACSVKLAETQRYTAFVQEDNYECQGTACVVGFTALPGQTVYLKPKEIIAPTETLTGFLVAIRSSYGIERIPNVNVQVFTAAGDFVTGCQGNNGYCSVILVPETDYIVQAEAHGYLCTDCPKPFRTSGSYMTVDVNMRQDPDACQYNACSEEERVQVQFRTYEKVDDVSQPVVGAEVKVFFAAALGGEAASCVSRPYTSKNGACEVQLCPYCKYYAKGSAEGYIDYGGYRAFDTFPNMRDTIWLKLTRVEDKEPVDCPDGYTCLSVEKARAECGLEVDVFPLEKDFSCTTDCKNQCAHLKEESRSDYYDCKEKCVDKCHAAEREQYCLDYNGLPQYYCFACLPDISLTKVSFEVIDIEKNTPVPNAIVKLCREEDYLGPGSCTAAVRQTGPGGEPCSIVVTDGRRYAVEVANYLMEDGSSVKIFTAQGETQTITLNVVPKEKPPELPSGIYCGEQYGPDYKCISNPIPFSDTVCPDGLDIKILTNDQYCLEGTIKAHYCVKCLGPGAPSLINCSHQYGTDYQCVVNPIPLSDAVCPGGLDIQILTQDYYCFGEDRRGSYCAKCLGAEPEVNEGDIGVGGGTVNSADGNIKVIFPSNAVAEDVVVVMTKRTASQSELNAASAVGKFIVNGVVYDLKAIAGSQRVFSFLQPVTVSITYAENPLIDEDSLVFAKFNESTSQWNVLPATIDKNNNTVTVQTTSFSGHALLFGAAAALDEPGTPGKKGEVCCGSNISSVKPNMGCDISAGLQCACDPDDDCEIGMLDNETRVRTRGRAGVCAEDGQTVICPPIPVPGIWEIVDRVVKWIFYIAAVIAPIMIILGAILLMTSAGIPEKARRGKLTVVWAIVGFAIVLIARVVVSLVINIVA